MLHLCFAAEIEYELTTTYGGYLAYVSNLYRSIKTFTQEDLGQGRVVFMHNGQFIFNYHNDQCVIYTCILRALRLIAADEKFSLITEERSTYFLTAWGLEEE